MGKILSAAAAALAMVFSLGAGPASAQSGCSNIATGAVLTAAQWQALIANRPNP